MTIHEIIKAKRKMLGMTQDELALLVGKNRTTVTKWESGSGFTRSAIKSLSRVLDIPVEKFLE